MTDTTSTPGPWLINHQRGGQILITSKMIERGLSGSLVSLTIATIPIEAGGHEDERQANAHLLAAAPCLLRVIELTLLDIEMRAEVEDNHLVLNISNHVYMQLVQARDVAKGLLNEQ